MRIRNWLWIIAALAGGAMASPVWADDAQDRQWCASGRTEPDIRIGACSRQIQSGRYDNRNMAFILNNRGNAYRKKGQLDRAIQDYGQAIRLKPDFTAALYNRGFAYEQLGDKGKALRDYKKAYALGYRHPLLLYRLRKLGALK